MIITLPVFLSLILIVPLMITVSLSCTPNDIMSCDLLMTS